MEDGETITNNEGKDTYTFTQNDEFTFTYADQEGNSYSSTAKVDWIDKESPTIANIDGDLVACKQTTLTVNAEDTLSGLTSYSFDNGQTWQESNTKEFTTTAENIIIQVKDKVGNVTTYEQPLHVEIGHDYGTWVIDKEPTTTEEGHRYRICNRCQDQQEETIPKITEEETVIYTTYTVKEQDNQKYILIQPNTAVSQALENITCNQEIEIIGTNEETLQNSEKIYTGAIVRTREDHKEQYIIAVKGDINGDGKVDFINDVIGLNNYRLNRIKLSTESILAGDINEDGKVDFIYDVIIINNYRLNRVTALK